MAGCLVERLPRRTSASRCRRWTPSSAPTNSTDRRRCAKGAARARDAAEPYLYHDLTPRVLATPRHYAYIKIAEGCDHPCTFCVIPQFRGRFRSRRSRVGRQPRPRGCSRRASARSTSSGRTPPATARISASATAWRCCWSGWRASKRRGPKWIRFLYAYPNRVTPQLLDTMAAHAALVPYIDMPLQHSSAARAEAHEARRLRRHFPEDWSSASGGHPRRGHPHQHDRRFPGRNRAGFRRNCASSSRRRGSTTSACSPTRTKRPAPATAWTARWTARTIYNRKRRLMAIQRKISRARNRRAAGPRSRRCWWKGLVQGNRPALAGAAGHAGARNRRRLLHQRRRGPDARARAATRFALPRARLRSDRNSDATKCPICEVPAILHAFCGDRCKPIDLRNGRRTST